MHINIEDVGPCKKKLEVELDPEKVKAEITDSFKDVRKNLALPGFRAGKVPQKLIEKRYGEKIHEDVRGKMLAESFEKAVKDYNLKPVSDNEPDEVDYDPKEGKLNYTVTIEVLPEFDLPEYKGVKVERTTVEVTDEDVENTIQSMLEERGQWKPVEGEIEGEDLIIAALEIKAGDDVILTHDNAGVAPRFGSIGGMQVEGISDAVVGKKQGDSVEIKITVPEDRGNLKIDDEHVGREAVIKLTANDVKRMQKPEMSVVLEELDYDDEAELREKVRDNLEKQRQAQADVEVENEILDKLLEAAEFDLPEERLEKESKILLDRKRVQLHQQGMKEEDIEKEIKEMEKKSGEEVRKSFRAQLLVERIAEKEKIFCTEEDVEARMNVFAMMYGASPGEIRNMYETRGMMHSLREEIKAEKVRKLLREKADIADKTEEAREGEPAGAEKVSAEGSEDDADE